MRKSTSNNVSLTNIGLNNLDLISEDHPAAQLFYKETGIAQRSKNTAYKNVPNVTSFTNEGPKFLSLLFIIVFYSSSINSLLWSVFEHLQRPSLYGPSKFKAFAAKSLVATFSPLEAIPHEAGHSQQVICSKIGHLQRALAATICSKKDHLQRSFAAKETTCS